MAEGVALGIPTIREARAGDLDALFRINEASTPGVGAVTRDELAGLLEIGAATFVAESGGRTVGFILCMTEGLAYASLNYKWVSERYPVFAYCDRIAVAPEGRGLGIGEALYQAAFRRFAGARPSLLCEVNLEPPNPGSLRFHQRLGFARVGERWEAGRAKGVVYLERRLGDEA